MSHDTIEGIMRDEPEIRDTPSKLIEAANDIEAKDDNSVWIIDIREVKKRRKGFFLFGQRISNVAASIAAGLLLAATGGGFFFANKNKTVKESITQSSNITTPPSTIKKSNSATTTTTPAISNEEANNNDNSTDKITDTKNSNLNTSPRTNTSTVPSNVPTAYSNEGNTAKGGDITNDAKRRKEMEQKMINWNDKKFKLHKKMTALEAFLPDDNTKALAELNTLQQRKSKLLKEFMGLIKLDKNKEPIYGKNNSVQLRDDIPTKTVESKFWSLHHQLTDLDNDFEVLCKENYCTMD